MILQLQYGIDSCFHETTSVVVTRVVLAVVVQVLCSYITLPLYALVTQMGSQYKSAVLEDQTRRMIKQWHEEVKHKLRKQSQSPLGSPISKIATQISSMEIFQHRRVPTLMDVPSRITNRTSEIVEEIQEA
ncbi:MLO-like protein 3 [Tanacetum coccineum]